MREWRLLKVRTYNAFRNMAIDEAILRARIQNLVPNTLRLYRWKPSAVSIGKFQNIQNEVQLENCRKHGVDVVRRITGGGTVYHDAEGEITYSVVADKKDLEVENITEVYLKVYSGIAEALEILGLKSDFSPGRRKNLSKLDSGREEDFWKFSMPQERRSFAARHALVGCGFGENVHFSAGSVG